MVFFEIKAKMLKIFEEYKELYKKQDKYGSHLKLMGKPFGFFLAKFFSKTKVITPNQVTLLSFIFYSLPGLFYAFGVYPYLIYGSIALLIGYLLDYADGQLARLKGTSNIFGKWLDAENTVFSRTITFLGITYGLYRMNPTALVWILGFLAVTSRYVFELTYTYFKALFPFSIESFEEEKKTRNKFIRNFYFTDNLAIVLLILAGLFNQLLLYLYFTAIYGWIFNILLFIVFYKKSYKRGSLIQKDHYSNE